MIHTTCGSGLDYIIGLFFHVEDIFSMIFGRIPNLSIPLF